MSYKYYRRPLNNQKIDKKEQPFFSQTIDRSPRAESNNNAFFQKKGLTIGQPGDKYEQEADAMADAVVNHASSNSPLQKKEINSIQRQTLFSHEQETSVQKQAEEEEPVQAKQEEEEMVQTQQEEEEPVQAKEEEEEEPVQAKQEDEEEPVQAQEEEEMMQTKEEEEEPLQAQEEEEEPIQAKGSGKQPGTESKDLKQELDYSRGQGQTLPKKPKNEMEHAFGSDFNGVTVHTDSKAIQMNKSLGAQAFTHGEDIYFNSGKYNPENSSGKRLLAHELTHVVQQKGADIKKKDDVNNDLKSPRFRGDNELENTLDNKTFIQSGSSGSSVTRIQQGLVDAGFPLPKFGVDGNFGNETTVAVKEYQKANALKADGIVGSKTMAALDLYYAVNRGSEPLPPKAGSSEAQILDILKKGAKMSKLEAKEVQKLLFELKEDDFKRAIKAAMESPKFMTWLGKLGILEILATLSKTSTEVVIPTTLLKPAANVIDADFTRANQIYNPQGIEIEKGNAKVLSEKESKKVIGNNLVLDEFTATSATAEELELIKNNRMKGRITGYWVPDMTSSRGEGLIKSDLGNMPDDRSSVVVNAKNRAQDTFAHEVGHLLGLDHTGADTIPDTTANDPNNLMTNGTNRKITGAGIDKLTPGQLAIIRKSLFLEIGRKGVGK